MMILVVETTQVVANPFLTIAFMIVSLMTMFFVAVGVAADAKTSLKVALGFILTGLLLGAAAFFLYNASSKPSWRVVGYASNARMMTGNVPEKPELEQWTWVKDAKPYTRTR